jgi:hypothetical protein
MKQLTETQKEFLLETFFRNEDYHGWRSIGYKLLDKGSCIVAGTKCIWVGGIGNFIKVTPAEDAFGCSEYKFNLKEFLDSDWFFETKREHVRDLEEKARRARIKFEDISKL